MATITIRPAVLADKNFILATWLRSLFYGGLDFYTKIEKDVFFAEYERAIQRLLINSEISIACLSEDEEVIVGYAVSNGPVLHFTYVKEPWRKQGIATKLVSPSTTTVTNLTKAGDAIRRKKHWGFNPWKLA